MIRKALTPDHQVYFIAFEAVLLKPADGTTEHVRGNIALFRPSIKISTPADVQNVLVPEMQQAVVGKLTDAGKTVIGEVAILFVAKHGNLV